MFHVTFFVVIRSSLLLTLKSIAFMHNLTLSILFNLLDSSFSHNYARSDAGKIFTYISNRQKGEYEKLILFKP